MRPVRTHIGDDAQMGSDSDDFDAMALAAAVEAQLLGGARTLSPNDLAEQSGVDREYARRLWRSMGFAITDDDEVALTAQDLAATQRVKRAVDLGILSPDEVVSLARLTGQVFAQLAESEGDTLFRIALANAAHRPTDVVGDLAAEILPLIEDVHAYVWRRQLAAYVARRAARYVQTGDADTYATVGFADISGYTSLSRRTSDADLAVLLERFESVATDAVGAHGGRVVKLIGDAVLFTAPDPATGVRIAVDLLSAWPDGQPPLRAGIASGAILRRLGDVFGPTVNIASRLTSLAAPGDIRVDDATHEGLLDAPDAHLVEQPPTDVRGYEQLRSWSVTSRRTA